MKKKLYILGVFSALLAVSVAFPALAEDATTSTSSVTTGTASFEEMKRPKKETKIRDMNKKQGNREREGNAQSVLASSEVSGAAVAALVITRENAIIAAHTVYFNAWAQARNTLSASLEMAWKSESSARREAIKKARATYASSIRDAAMKRKKDVIMAIHRFRDELKKLSPSASVAAEANADAMSAGASDVQ